MSSDTIFILSGKQYDKQQDRDVFFSQNDAEVMNSARKKLIKAWVDSQNPNIVEYHHPGAAKKAKA